ncbi:tRNA lysidine(34) synthetase TilS [Tistrella bauzanensis]|uniref:tRNA lysidine(34) synthetase TilS n=1 Tax=Tistrella TaxID=171436 RepID=UPI0031F615EB
MAAISTEDRKDTACGRPDRVGTAVGHDDLTGRFAAAMMAAGIVEASPHLAVALSGGPDSLALTLLARDWARMRGGRVTALVVDHGLRAGSDDAARAAAGLAGRLGVAARILTLPPGSLPAAGIEAAARRARYDRLARACRDAGILHLLVGHSLDDLAETVLIRLGRGSGIDGLAAMAAIRPHQGLRLLRPLLGLRRAGLARLVAQAGLTALHDPMNDDGAVQRVRLRRAAAPLCDAGLDPAGIARSASRAARARATLDDRLVRAAFAGGLRFHPWGGAELPLPLFAEPALTGDLAPRLVERLCLVIGGLDLPPRQGPVMALTAALIGQARAATRSGNMPQGGRTLGGCRIVWGGGRVTVLREPAAVAAPVPVVAGERIGWDGRFIVQVPNADVFGDGGAATPLTLGAMGASLAMRLGLMAPDAARRLRNEVPGRAIASLPVLRRLDVPVAFPHLTGSIRGEAAADHTLAHPHTLAQPTFRAWFAPSRPFDGDGVFWTMAGEHSAGKRPRS